MSDIQDKRQSWYPTRRLTYVIGVLLAILVENSAEPFTRNTAAFLGGLIVQLLLIFAFPRGIAGLIARKKDASVFGWSLLVLVILFAGLAYIIAHQS